MRALCILLFLSSFSVTAQVTESDTIIEKNNSNRLTIPETEMKLLKIKFTQNTETIEVSEGSISKNASNRLVISETEEEILKSRFLLSVEKVTKNENRKLIATNPEVIDFFQNQIKTEK